MRDFGQGGTHTKATYKDEWLTPPRLVEQLGPFDLDPCAPVERPWDTARAHFTIVDDGLAQDWSGHGLIWLNPPYSTWPAWVERLIGHPGGGIALLFARTDTRAFRRVVWSAATSMLFLHGRISFHYPNGTESRRNGGAPSVLVAYGDEAARRLDDAGVDGQIVRLGAAGVVALRRQPRLPLSGSAQRRLRAVG